VSYHEAFWMVTGTAAPIIALAAVVALPEAAAVVPHAWARGREIVSTPPHLNWHVAMAGSYEAWRRVWAAAQRVRTLTFLNVIVQAGLLAVSLSALAVSQNVMPPWVAIVLAVGGILLLAWTLPWGAAISRTSKNLDKPRALLKKDIGDD
jgi:hypothetical protein